MNAIIQNQSLKAYNTFGIDVAANYFAGFNTVHELGEILDSAIFQQNKQLILYSRGPLLGPETRVSA